MNKVLKEKRMYGRYVAEKITSLLINRAKFFTTEDIEVFKKEVADIIYHIQLEK